MKRISPLICSLAIAAIILGLNGCKSGSLMHCPDLASSKKAHTPLFAFNHHIKKTKPASNTAQPVVAAADSKTKPVMLANSDNDMHFQLKLPNSIDAKMEEGNGIDDMNKVLADFSANKVKVALNSKGKLVLQAHSLKDIFKLAKASSNPRGYRERGYGGREVGDGASNSAIASSILGPISFIFAFIPVLSLVAIPMSIAAIVTGGVGLSSPRKRRAVVGLTFGVLGLIFSLLFSWLYWLAWAVIIL
jgi:hypothetical protein